MKDEVTISLCEDGHDGPGWYWHFTDYPEEGVAGAFKSFEDAKASAERNDGIVKGTAEAATGGEGTE